MTSPPATVRVICECGQVFKATYRPSVNRNLDRWTDEEITAATTAKCPRCAVVIDLGALIIESGEA